jgi:hypothetical protein
MHCWSKLAGLLELALKVGNTVLLLLSLTHQVLVRHAQPIVFVIKVVEFGVEAIEANTKLVGFPVMLALECQNAAAVSFLKVGNLLLLHSRLDTGEILEEFLLVVVLGETHENNSHTESTEKVDCTIRCEIGLSQ